MTFDTIPPETAAYISCVFRTIMTTKTSGEIIVRYSPRVGYHDDGRSTAYQGDDYES